MQGLLYTLRELQSVTSKGFLCYQEESDTDDWNSYLSISEYDIICYKQHIKTLKNVCTPTQRAMTFIMTVLFH